MVLVLVGLGVAIVAAERVWLAARLPLWLDETWTAAIVSAPDWRSFGREVYLDVNAPLYYLLMRAWSGLFGLSDFALRLPTLLAILAAGLIAARARLPGLSREASLAWGALVFFWWGVGVFLDARCYGLLLLISVCQCIAYARLMQKPNLAAAVLWVALSGLAVLCQYYAALIGLAQGVIYLAVHRGRAVKTWPAVLLLAPVLGWISIHASRLKDYARPDVAWHSRVDAVLAIDFSSFTLGAFSLALTGSAILIVAAAAVIPRLSGRAARDDDAPGSPHLWAVAGAGLLTLALALLSGVLRPSLTARYLVPIAPSMLLGLVLCARATAGARAAYAALALTYLGFALAPADQRPYGNEQASAFLMSKRVSDVVFIWDHPAARIMDPGSLRRVGAVFFRRAGDPARITPLIVEAGDDPNRLALAAAAGPRPGVIWIFDRTSNTAARTAPPRFTQLDPHWSCRLFGDDQTGSVACYRRTGS